MAIRITTTHIWTKVFIPVIWISRLLLLGLVLSIIDLLDAKGDSEVVLFIIGLLVALVIHGVFIEQFYHVIQTYLYVTVTLGTKINMQDARYLMFLFAPSELGKWYPMEGIKELPKNIRRQALLDSAKKIYQKIGHYPPEPERQYTQTETKTTSQHDPLTIMDGFSDLVSMLCTLAKADNHISEEEVAIINSFFVDVLELSTKQQSEAIEFFNKARLSDVSFEAYAHRFVQHHRHNKNLLEAICTLLTNLALADGELSAEEEILLNEAITIFDVPGSAYHDFKTKQRRYRARTSDKDKQHAKVLGLEGELTYEKIRQAYRQLAFQYHPDKVAHLGDKIKEVAEHEMKLVNEAYEHLKSRYMNKKQSVE